MMPIIIANSTVQAVQNILMNSKKNKRKEKGEEDRKEERGEEEDGLDNSSNL